MNRQSLRQRQALARHNANRHALLNIYDHPPEAVWEPEIEAVNWWPTIIVGAAIVAIMIFAFMGVN